MAEAGTNGKKESLWSPQFLIVMALTLFNGLCGQMTLPLVAKYALHLGADLTLASTCAGLMSMVSLIVCPVAGVLADRVDRKKLLTVCSLGYAIALTLHALASNVGMLIVCRLLTGVFFSINSVTYMAFSASFIPKERMGEGLGYVGLATILSQAVGPAAGLFLQSNVGFFATFLAAGVCALVCMVIITLMKYRAPAKDPAAGKKKLVLNDIFAVEFTCFMLLAALFSSANGMVSTYLAILADERHIENIALFFTAYSVFLVVLRPVTGKLMDKKGVYFIMVPAVVCAAAGMFIVGIGYSLGVMILGSFFKAVGQGCGTPSMQAHVVKRLDKDKAGVATSTIMVGQNVGNALAPILGSFVVQSMGYEGMFKSVAVIIAVAGAALLVIQNRLEKNA